MRIELDVNGKTRTLDVEPRTTLLDCLARPSRPQGRACRLRARRLRRLHGAGRRRGGALLPDVRAAGGRHQDHHHRRRGARARRTVAGAGRVLRNPRHAMRLLHAGDDPGGARAARRQSRADARGDRRGDLRQHLPLHRLCADRRSDRARRRAHARRQPPGGADANERRRPFPLRLHRPPRARGPPLRRRQGPVRRRRRSARHQARGAGHLPLPQRAHRQHRRQRRAEDARRALRARRRANSPRPRCR